MKVVTIAPPHGPVMVSADVHGNWDDFAALRAVFLARVRAGDDPVWVSVGDWVHGPSPDGRRGVRASDGEELYDYDDATASIMPALFALMDAHPGRVMSVLGNHEHAHIGGRRTRKFHDDEAAHLEAGLTAAEIAELHRRLHGWPLCVRVPACGVVVTHAAMGGPITSPADLEAIAYAGPNDDRSAEILHITMTRYGFSPGDDADVLAALSEPGQPPYQLLVHGHDREESGWADSGERAVLLCTSFGAPRANKTYLVLDSSRRYGGPRDLREGVELLRLWPT